MCQIQLKHRKKTEIAWSLNTTAEFINFRPSRFTINFPVHKFQFVWFWSENAEILIA